MFYLYLDESGDLGFDLSKAGTTKHFVVTVLLLPSMTAKRAMEKAVTRTIKMKIRRGRKHEPAIELKGSKATAPVKAYFHRIIRPLDFSVYAIILDKSKLAEQVLQSQARLYSHLARRIIDRIPCDRAHDRISITLDRNKAMIELEEFNRFLLAHLEAAIDPKIPIEIFHADSAATPCLQAADMLSSALFNKYEWHNLEWYDHFAEKVKWHEIYTPLQNKKRVIPTTLLSKA